MKAIKAKSFTVRIMFALALACAPLASAACGGTDTPPPPGGTSDGTCGGFIGKACPEQMFCDFEANTCGQGDALGKCQQLPTVCTEECNMICGCDGRAYCNACMAHMAGVDDAADTTCDKLP